MEITIKKLTTDLYTQTNGLFETLQNLTKAKPLQQQKVQKILCEIEKQNTTIFVAITQESKIVATAKVIIEQKLTRNGGYVGHIEDVVTRKGYEGQGIQTKIMKTAIHHAKEKGCYKVILNCSQKNIPYYERFGFKQHEVEMRLDF